MQWYFRKQNRFYFSEFGPIVIDYGKVQAKVSMKYDSWHKDALSKFGTMLGTDMSSFHSTVMIFLQIACNLKTIFIKYNNIWILTFFRSQNPVVTSNSKPSRLLRPLMRLFSSPMFKAWNGRWKTGRNKSTFTVKVNEFWNVNDFNSHLDGCMLTILKVNFKSFYQRLSVRFDLHFDSIWLEFWFDLTWILIRFDSIWFDLISEFFGNVRFVI